MTGSANGPNSAEVQPEGGDTAMLFPEIVTPRLVLNAFQPADAEEVERLANDPAIAATTLSIDHPCPSGAGDVWIRSHAGKWASGKALELAIRLVSEDSGAVTLTGAIGLQIDSRHHHAELGYWISSPWWNRGLATEAALAICRFGFDRLGLNRIYAHHMMNNPASGRVLRKVGMVREGTLRQHIRKWGRFQDLALYGMLPGELASV